MGRLRWRMGLVGITRVGRRRLTCCRTLGRMHERTNARADTQAERREISTHINTRFCWSGCRSSLCSPLGSACRGDGRLDAMFPTVRWLGGSSLLQKQFNNSQFVEPSQPVLSHHIKSTRSPNDTFRSSRSNQLVPMNTLVSACLTVLAPINTFSPSAIDMLRPVAPSVLDDCRIVLSIILRQTRRYHLPLAILRGKALHTTFPLTRH